MQIVYPSDYFNRKKVDDVFEDEYNHAKNSGLTCLLLSTQHTSDGKYLLSQSLEPDVPVLWRGWMLKPEEYQRLHRAVSDNGCKMLVSCEDYVSCHYITGWYDACKKYTPETVFSPPEGDFDLITASLNWPAYFVKDYVKSLTTSRGSIATSADDIREVIQAIETYRGGIEGGISLRKVENIIQESERRYFCLNHQVYASDDVVPGRLTEIARCINSPFFSIDVAENDTGELRLIEIGDGQVSDIKEWHAEKFIQMLGSA